MAKARAICTCRVCGKTFEKTTIRGNRHDADSWEKWAESTFTICPECERKEREAKAAELAKQAEADGLPALVGSPKQIVWAEQIRADYMESSAKAFDEILEKIRRRKEAGKDVEALELGAKRFDATRTFLLTTEKSAHWWIDNRYGLVYIMDKIYINRRAEIDRIMDGGDAQPEPEEDTGEAAAEETVLVAPETPRYGEAEIRVSATAADASYPAMDEAFRKAVKAAGFAWDSMSRLWVGTESNVNGTAMDRAAEAAANLLRAGFLVRCTAEVRDLALSGGYVAYTTRVVRLCTAGEYCGWLSISLPERGDDTRDDVYRAARRIRGADYADGHIRVPMSARLEVEDFAGLYGYRFSPAAEEAMAKFKIEK